MIDEISAVDFLLPVVLYVMSMIYFLSLKERKDRWLDISALLNFVVYWVVVVAFAPSVKYKVFVSLPMLSIVGVRYLVKRRRKSMNRGAG